MKVEFPAFTHKLLAAKKAKGLSFGDLEQLLGHDEVWIASLFYGQNSTSIEGKTSINAGRGKCGQEKYPSVVLDKLVT